MLKDVKIGRPKRLEWEQIVDKDFLFLIFFENVFQAFQISNLIREYIEVLRTGVGSNMNGDIRHVAQLTGLTGEVTDQHYNNHSVLHKTTEAYG